MYGPHVCNKEESKVANRDWVDHQAYSLLQYINIIANRFIREIILTNCAEKILEPTIFFNLYTIEVTIELGFFTRKETIISNKETNN